MILLKVMPPLTCVNNLHPPIVGIMAMAMSTADSYINSSSVLFSNDICHPFKIGLRKELFLSRLFAIILGFGAIILALSAKDLLSIILMASSVYMPVVTAPLILTILGFRSTEKSVLIGMFAGIITSILWDSFGTANSIMAAIACNALFFVGSHYLLKQEGGWLKEKNSLSLERTKRQKIKKWILKLDFHKAFTKLSPQNDLTYVGLGVYFLIYTLTTIYSTQVELLKDNGKIILAFYQIMLITGTIMSMYPIWPLSLKKNIKLSVIQIWWPVAIFYMLIFFNTFFVIASNFSILQFSMFSINLIIAALIVGWRLALFIIPIGFYLGIGFYQSYFGEYSFNLNMGSPEFVLAYVMVLIGIVLIIFLKPKQEYLEATEEKAEHLKYEVKGLEREVGHARGELENVVQGQGNCMKFYINN